MGLFVSVGVLLTIAVSLSANSGRRDDEEDCTYCHCNSSILLVSSLQIGTCLSCDPVTCDNVVRGICLFDLEANSSIQANFFSQQLYFEPPPPNTCQELETRLCGTMNRQGFLCKKCRPGYGPAPYSISAKCYECKDDGSARQWLLYLALELVPSTAFFFVVVFFNIRTTAPPYTAFVFFSQSFALLYKVQPYIRFSLNLRVNKVVLQGILTLISFWNLDFFRHVVPPFCISSKLTDFHVLFLNFISALYPLFLVVLTLVLIELHARNFCPLVILWKPVHKYFASCRRKLDPKASVITASATFIMLSFGKVVVIAFLAFTIHTSNGVKMSLYDINIACNSTEECFKQLISIPYYLPVFIGFTIVHLPTLLLLLYPIKGFRRLLSCCCCSKLHAINVFVETFQGHYKDGTGGSRDYRAVSGISFLLRTLFCWFLQSARRHTTVPVTGSSFRMMIYLLIVTSLFYGVAQPCKKKYMNVVECVVYCTAGYILLSIGSFHGHSTSSARIYSRLFDLYLPLIFLVLPSVVLFILSAAKIFSCHCCCCCSRKGGLEEISHESDEEYPDRLKHPSDYEPLK